MVTAPGQAYDALMSGQAVVRRHWPFAAVFAAGVALRAAAAIAYRPALVYIDTPRYLGGDQGGLDPLGYSYLLLRPLLLAGAGLGGVAVAQHVLGLAMAACLYALAIRHGAGRWLAALAAVPVLLDAYQVEAEQTIMPDVLFESLIVAAMTVLLWPRRQVAAGTAGAISPAGAAARRTARADLRRLAAGAALLGLAATVRQAGELLVLPLLAFALVAPAYWRASRPGGRERERERARARARAVPVVAALAVFALPVVGYMALSSAVLGTGFRLSNMDDAYLYGRLARAADCATLRLPAGDRPLCPAPATAAALGADGLATNPSSPVFSYRPPPGTSRGTATKGFDDAVLSQQPLRVAAGVAGDAIKVFALTRDTATGDPPVARWQFQTSYPVYRAADRAVLASAMPRVTAPLAAVLRAYQLHGGFTPGPLLLAFLLLGTAGCLAHRRQPALAAGCLLATGLAIAAVGGADLYEFSWRYQLPALVTLPLAGALGATAFLRLAVTHRSGGGSTMVRCETRPSQRSRPSQAASSTATTGSGSERTTSSAPTGPGAPTPS